MSHSVSIRDRVSFGRKMWASLVEPRYRSEEHAVTKPQIGVWFYGVVCSSLACPSKSM